MMGESSQSDTQRRQKEAEHTISTVERTRLVSRLDIQHAGKDYDRGSAT